MKILQICKKFPYPLKDGESVAVANISKALHELGCEISLLTMNTSKHYFEYTTLPDFFDHYQKVHIVDVDNQINIKGAVLNLFSTQSYHVSRFYSKEFEMELIRLISAIDFDIIQIETIYLSLYIGVIKKYSKAKVVVRTHNVEHEIWDRIADKTDFLPKKIYLKECVRRLKKFESIHLNYVDAVVAISFKDLSFFRKLGLKKEACVIPVGLNSDDYHPNYESYTKPIAIGFIGALDWIPNLQGLEWFLNAVWPKLSAKHPNLKFNIAGSKTPDSLKKLCIPNVTFFGEVPCSKDFMNSSSVLIVPLFSGSGIRVKILEGLALGRTIISTSIGYEGINASPMKNILIADTVKEFIEAIDFSFNNIKAIEEFGKRGRLFIEKEYDRYIVAQKLKKFYETILEVQQQSRLPNPQQS